MKWRFSSMMWARSEAEVHWNHIDNVGGQLLNREYSGKIYGYMVKVQPASFVLPPVFHHQVSVTESGPVLETRDQLNVKLKGIDWQWLIDGDWTFTAMFVEQIRKNHKSTLFPNIFLLDTNKIQWKAKGGFVACKEPYHENFLAGGCSVLGLQISQLFVVTNQFLSSVLQSLVVKVHITYNLCFFPVVQSGQVNNTC